MAYAYPKDTAYGREIPNWLSSEVGLTLKTALLTSDMGETVNGRKIVKSGSVFTGSGLTGLVFGDADVTDGDIEFAIMVGGRVYENRLPATISDKSALTASGIIFDTAAEVTRV